MSPDGELVSRRWIPARVRPARRAGAAPPKPRRSRIGAGAAISGLALGALAIGAVIIAGDTPTSAEHRRAAVDRRAPAAARRALIRSRPFYADFTAPEAG